MHYDQSWMGFGLIGALQAAGIAVAVGVVLSLVFDALGRRHDWGPGAPLGWSFLLTVLLAASGDLRDLFYFNYGRLQSLTLLKAKLATVHDPDSMGLRALFEVLGAVLGVYLGAMLARSHWWRNRFGPRQ